MTTSMVLFIDVVIFRISGCFDHDEYCSLAIEMSWLFVLATIVIFTLRLAG